MPILVTCECGKQFQAKDENVGRRFNCPVCNREVVVPKPEGDPYAESPMFAPLPTKTSGNAIASLILGIISVLGCTLFTGIPAIICGILGLNGISKSKGRLEGKGLAISGIVTGSLGLLFVPITIALLLPAVQAAREAARRSQCVNNMKQIGLALHNYHSINGHFPPASSVNAEGKPLLSWRVAILPLLNQQELYDEFKQDEPWDGPNNIRLLDRMPDLFRCPSDAAMPGGSITHYEVISGPGSAFEGPDGQGFQTFIDGTSNTLAVVEAKAPVEWTKPDDVDIKQVIGSLGSKHPGGFNVLMADGSVRFIKNTINPMVLQSLATRNGGEVVSAAAF
jgi:prepilin-type processing-associated H-X9-DG protein